MDFKNIQSYVREDRQAKVVKLHGSIDWFKLIGSRNQSWEELVSPQDVFQRAPDNAIYVENHRGPLMEVIISGNRPYPILTAPLAGKGMANLVCPSEHIEIAKHFLADCRKFLIIGSSGLDKDLLNLLDENIDPSLRPVIQLVGGPDGEQALQRFESGVRAFRRRRIMPPGYLFGNGFRKYVDDGQLAEFATFDPRCND
jgi:hypothetical protein